MVERGEILAAENAYRDILADQQEVAAILCRLGFLLLDQQRRDEAHDHFLQALAAEPGLSMAYLGLGRIYEVEGRPGEALAAFEAGRSHDSSFERFESRIEELRLISLETPPARVLVADGAEDEEGRALFLISALHQAAPELGRTRVRFLNVATDAVRTAIEVLSWDCGFEVEAIDPAQSKHAALQPAAAFAAVGFRESPRLAVLRARAESAGLPCLVAVQFLGPDASASALMLSRAAHDPAVLGAKIRELMYPT